MKTILEKCAENIPKDLGDVFVEENYIRVAHPHIDIFIKIFEKGTSCMQITTSPLCTITAKDVNDVKRKIFDINQDKTLAKLSVNEQDELVVTCNLFLGKNADNKFVFNKCLYSVLDVLSAYDNK